MGISLYITGNRDPPSTAIERKPTLTYEDLSNGVTGSSLRESSSDGALRCLKEKKCGQPLRSILLLFKYDSTPGPSNDSPSSSVEIDFDREALAQFH